jgi:amidophosphoribosyltransferase
MIGQGIREKCGVIAVYDSPRAAQDLYLGLHAQQHRGQEGAGILVSEGPGRNALHRDQGLVTAVFGDEVLGRLPGHFGIGHVRYATAGCGGQKDVQPLVVTHRDEVIAIAHNGNITNAGRLKDEMERSGSLFQTSSDTEVVLHRIVREAQASPIERVKAGLRDVEGAYSLVLKFNEAVIGVRDPVGFRPLHLGKRDETWLFASETCAFDIVGAEWVCEVEPGHGFMVSENGLEHFTLDTQRETRFCAFELVYFSRPDSRHAGQSIHSYRVDLGRALFAEHPADADVVTAVPDSSNSAALGYAHASGIPLDIGLIRSHFSGRTFIAPHQSLRDSRVRQKFNVVRDAVEGKRVVVVDDSVVRGTTSRKIMQLFRENGAREVHFRIASPMVQHPCFFGVDMPERGAFLANKVPEDMLRHFLGVDSLGFLSRAALRRILGTACCDACFTGEYPVPVQEMERQVIKRKERPLGKFDYV